MDNKRFSLGPEEDSPDVDDLLAQINDESILKLAVNTHQSTTGMRVPLWEEESEHQDLKDGTTMDPALEARFASLKAPPRPKPKAGKSKQQNHAAAAAAPAASPNRDTEGERSGSDGGDSLDDELMARLQALKGPSVASKTPEGESALKSGSSGSSGSNTPTLSEHLQTLKSRSRKSPQQMSPSRPDFPAAAVTVGSSGWCAPTSPFKLMRVLSSKNPAPVHAAGPASRSSSKPHSSQAKDAKKAVKKSLSHSSKAEDEVDPAAMVADVQRLLAAVSTEERKQRAVSAGDKRAFNMKDRDAELLRALEDEEAIALEAEKVVEWAKDNARLEGSDKESEDELELEISDSDDSDVPAQAKLTKATKKKTVEDSDPEETIGKAKKRKGRRRWNFM